jgi:diguanylate cyclase (GGDEF)-like protein
VNAAVPALQRVLIVDDEPANVHSLAQALGGSYDLRFATDATRALELAASIAFDLILLDVVMPGMDGFEVLRRLKGDEATRNVPVIFVTSMGEVADEELGFTLGAVDYITKPASAPLVRARVRTHIELKRQHDLLAHRALIDELTGIANRRRFDEALEQRWRHALRDNAPLLLMLIDVDLFKQYNDHYGHAAGDDCLKRIAGVLRGAFSQGGELAARIGGEEFALLLPGGNVPAQAQRLLQGVRDLQLAHACSSASAWVSVSAGAIETVPKADASGRALLEAADQLLYQAKHAGRARCIYTTMQDSLPRTVALERDN